MVIFLVSCGILYDVVNLIIGKVVAKNRMKNEESATEAVQQGASGGDNGDNDNVTVPRTELKRILWELNELKRYTNSSLDTLNTLKENTRYVND